MANGEVLFEEPWQGRVFGMAVALHEAGLFDWSEFQARLIEVIGDWDRQASDAGTYHYYQHFQRALNNLLAAKGLVDAKRMAQGLHSLGIDLHSRRHHDVLVREMVRDDVSRHDENVTYMALHHALHLFNPERPPLRF